MSVHGIGGAGSPSALAALRLALRLGRTGGGAVGAAEPSEAVTPAVVTPDSLLHEIVGRAQFQASIRAAAAAVEQTDTVIRAFYRPAE